MFRMPILTVDAVILTLVDGQLMVALMERADEPFAGKLALPGGFVHADPQAGKVDASTTEAMLRILKSKLGFVPGHLEQVSTVSGPKRDPRGWSASVLHLALHHHSIIEPMVNAGLVQCHDAKQLPRSLAFDHRRLIDEAVDRLTAKANYSTILAHLLPPVFRLADLQAAHESVTGTSVNKDNFRRKILESNVLEEAELIRHSGGRPAQGYRIKAGAMFLGRQLGQEAS